MIRQIRFNHIVLLTALLFIGLISFDLLLKDPPVWPDEAIYADTALNIIRDGYVGTDLNKGMYPFGESYSFGYPPLFMNAIAVMFRFLGFSIETQRTFSFLVGSGTLLGFYLFAADIIGRKKFWLLSILLILISTDYTFLRASHLSRPEIMIMFFESWSLFFFYKSFKERESGGVKVLWPILSGLFSSLAVMTHFVGVFLPAAQILFLLAAYRLKVLKTREVYIFCLALLLPVVAWLSSVLPHLNIFWAQNTVSLARKLGDETWLLTVFTSQPLIVKLIYLFYLLISLIFLGQALKSHNRARLLTAFVLTVSWIICIIGKQFWYYVFPVPFVYLAVVLMVEQFIEKQELSKGEQRLRLILPVALVTVPLYISGTLLWTNVNQYNKDGYRYQSYAEEVLRHIPPDKTVFLSAIPDPYYAIKSRGRNVLYEFPSMYTRQENYLDVLNNTDFVVYTGSYETMVFGDFLGSYLNKNAEDFSRVGKIGDYQAWVIKLKDRGQRVGVN